jgi:3-oxoacyl-[acyl-carrier-protein] synthase-3
MKTPFSFRTPGYIALSAYTPAKSIPSTFKNKLVEFLRNHTLLQNEYIEMIDYECKLPGSIETNEEGWIKQPWYDAWVNSMPEKKRADPFQGTKERRRVPLDPKSIKQSLHPHPMLPSDAETIAASMAICSSNINPDDIDLVMSHSQVPDRPLPQNASLIQYKLQLKNAGAYGVDSCCSSFMTMTELACSLVASGIKKNILIVSSFLDSHVNDKSTHFSVDTGDSSVAAIISAVDEGYGYLASCSTSHGERHDGIIYEHRAPLLLQRLDSGPNYSQMFTTFFNVTANKEIAKNAAIDLKFVVEESLKKANLSINDIDFFVTHQPVAWAGNVWRESIGIPPSKFYESFEKYGNIATCATATNLLEAIERKLIKSGNNIIIASSGAGENHIGIVMKVPSVLVDNITASYNE